MLIKKIVLHKFKRFSLKGIEHFELVPESKLVIFNWANGIGKSSLLSQLNPLPADLKKDFYPEGYKEITLEHNGKEYIISSKDGKHSLKEEGIELNQGNTKKVQLQLVNDIFKIDNNKLDVINGINLFTNMSPSERKSWLTKISIVDYIYPISVYGKLLERKKDLIAWKKLANEKLLEANNLLQSYNSIEDLLKQEKVLTETIEEFLKQYHNVNYTNENEILERLNKLNKLYTSNPLYKGYYNVDKYQIYVKVFIEKESLLKQKLEEFYKIGEEIEKLKKEEDSDSVSLLLNKIKKIEETISPYLLELILKYGDKEVYNKFNSYKNDFSNLYLKIQNIEELLPDINKDYNLEKTSLSNDIVKLENDIISTKKETEHLTSLSGYSKLVCHNCGCNVKIDLSKIEFQSLESLSKLLEDKRNLYKQIEYKIQQQEYYKSIRVKIDNFITNNEFIKAIEGLSFHKEGTLSNIIKFLLNGLNSITYALSNNDLSSYKEDKEKVKELNINSLVNTKLKETELKNKQNTLDLLNKEIYLLREEIEKIKSENASFNKYKEIRDLIKVELKKYRVIEKNKKKELENQFIDKYVKELKEQLITLRNTLEKYKSLENDSKRLQKEIIDYDKELIKLDDLLTVLSPTKGLIAKSINSFLGVIIKEMNSIINTVWSYNMELLPCNVEGDKDLDYKFRVLVNDDHEVEDISKLSSSMQEIVNLAFRLVFIKYCNLQGIPLILDEFGRTMDREHRINSFNMVDQILLNNFDQVFLVSHFEEMYGRFNNAQFPTIE